MFTIYACENKYAGLHGMQSFEVIDEEFNIKLAREYGREASRDIINSYSCIHTVQKQYIKK